jgi:hypothetical protein
MGEDGRVVVWDRKTGQRHGQLLFRVASYQDLLSLTPEGLVAGAGPPADQPNGGVDQQRIWFYDVQAGKVVQTFRVQKTTSGFLYLLALAVSSDGRTVAVGQSDGNAVLYEVATGQVRRVLRGHRDAISTLAFTPDNRLVTTSLDHTCLVWDVSLRAGAAAPAKPLGGQERVKLWEALGHAEPRPAFDALGKLAADPKSAVGLLRQHLRPARGVNDATLARIIQDLDSKQFKVRRQASQELNRLGETVLEGVKRRLAQTRSLEVRLRLKTFVDKFDRAEPTAERLREARALQLLEELATPEALRFLRDLARGNANAPQTRQAAQALKRCRQANR